MSARSWPSSPLAAAERAFTLLTTPPTHLGFDGRGFPGLPDRIVPLEDLRALLLSRQVDVATQDEVWRELVVRARRDGPAWVVAAAGIAMPGLRHTAGMLTFGWRGDTSDLDAELLAGFVAHLKTIDLQPRRVVGRLIDAGLRAARKARDAESDTHLVRANHPDPTAPRHPWDHPELVLARAVQAGVLDVDDAHLIGATRLDGITLAQAGERNGIDAEEAEFWRRKAEQRLREAIRDGELAFALLPPTPPGAKDILKKRVDFAALVAQRLAAATQPRRSPTEATQQPSDVGSPLGRGGASGAVLGAQQKPLVGETPDRDAVGVRAPGIGARPA